MFPIQKYASYILFYSSNINSYTFRLIYSHHQVDGEAKNKKEMSLEVRVLKPPHVASNFILIVIFAICLMSIYQPKRVPGYVFVNRSITDWNRPPEGKIGTSHGKTRIFKTRVRKVKTSEGE